MIPLAIPQLAGNELRYLEECIQTGFVSSVGPFVDRFEAAVAAASGHMGAVATSAGTTALHAALTVLGVGRDDLVIVPSLTFIATANAVAHCGAGPWLVDISPETWTLDADLLARSLESEAERTPHGVIHRPTGRRVAAIIAVYTLGLPADMESLAAIATQWGLPLVADAAAALGATSGGRSLGELGATLTAFSFNGNKTVTCGAGGAVAGNDRAVLAQIRHVTSTARVGGDYLHDQIGFNYRMSNLQAAVGVAQMEQLDGFIAAKRRIRRRYNEAFADLPGITFFPAPPDREGACWFSGFVLKNSDENYGTAFREKLRAGGIDARPFWRPIHMQPPYAESPRTLQPVAESVWQQIITLPSSTSLSDDEQDQVITVVRAALGAG